MGSTTKKLWWSPSKQKSFGLEKIEKPMFTWPGLILSTEDRILLFQNNKFKTIKHNPGIRFYGISWSGNDLFLSTHNSVIKCYKSFDKEFQRHLGSQDVHQIFFHKGLLYLTSTKSNQIKEFTIDLFLNRQYTYEVEKENTTKQQDYTHINSIFIDNEKIFLCHHNHDKPSFISVHNKDKNMTQIEKIENIGSQSHNIFVHENNLYTLDSKNCILVIVDLNLKKTERIFFNPGDRGKFIYRGLCCYEGDKFIIGASTNAMKEERNDHYSKIYIYDNTMSSCIDGVTLPFPGQIRDIRLIDRVDLAHSSVRFPIKNLDGE